MEPKLFGTLPDHTDVYQYVLKNSEIEVRILNYGGIITDFICHGRNIVCGFETLQDYLTDDSYQGALIGRFANRIAGASFTLNGKTYHVGQNEKGNTLHGGHKGFDKRVFGVKEATEDTLVLYRTSPDGEEGYPGNLSLRATYSIKGNALTISYAAITDADTPVSITNHSYFNLAGIGTSVLDFNACIPADHYTDVDADLIPTGKRLPVANTPYDLRSPRPIGDMEGGYDTNFVLSKDPASTEPTLAATVSGGGLTLSIHTTQPCVQFYTACVLTGEPAFRGGVKKAPFTAFCLETQEEPDAPNHGGAILRAGEAYAHTTVYRIEKNA